MKYRQYPQRDSVRNYFPLSNEIYHLDLSAGAITVYGYLLHIENRETYQAQAGYNTIGRAVKMSANTVHKYVLELEERHLIHTESTTIITKDGRKRNGSLRYTIQPFREVLDTHRREWLEPCRI